MENKKTIQVVHHVTISSDVRRGVTFTGLQDSEALKRKLKGNFSMATASAFPMYRWFWEPHGPIVDARYYKPPRNFRARKAVSLDKSLGNLLLSHLPGWALLPDKETSATLYSNINTANSPSKKPTTGENNSGRTFIAVPESNAKLVVAPTADTRDSFQYALGQFGIAGNEKPSLLQLDIFFSNLLLACGMKKTLFGNWKQYLTTFNEIAFEKIRPTDRLFKESEIILATLIKNRLNLLDFLDQAFSPLHNGFKVVDFNDSLRKEEYPDNEIWMSAPCILIEEKQFKLMTEPSR